VVHEWGTFTCLQDEEGRAVSGVNSDEEPLPSFAHNLASDLIIDTPDKGVPKCHPDVTMRLETPVIYFHPAKSMVNPIVADVEVKFRGGWLTQFYPFAEADAPGLGDGRFDFGRLDGDTVGSLSWKAIKIAGGAEGPATHDRVWTAPRAVHATSVTTSNGESERFLFYRGVGHIDAPLRVAREEATQRLMFRGQIEPSLSRDRPLKIPQIWLAEIRADGTSAFRDLGAVDVTSDRSAVLTGTAAEFDPGAFQAENLWQLRDRMHQAVTAAGLFADEADALLNTWELSYFQSPGLRVFFIVPRAWTDHYLPLSLSIPAEVTRVMVGRIELVTPARRRLAREAVAVESVPREQQGSSSFQQLGRFRDALVLDEKRRQSADATIRPSP